MLRAQPSLRALARVVCVGAETGVAALARAHSSALTRVGIGAGLELNQMVQMDQRFLNQRCLNSCALALAATIGVFAGSDTSSPPTWCGSTARNRRPWPR